MFTPHSTRDVQLNNISSLSLCAHRAIILFPSGRLRQRLSCSSGAATTQTGLALRGAEGQATGVLSELANATLYLVDFILKGEHCLNSGGRSCLVEFEGDTGLGPIPISWELERMAR